MRQNRCNVMRQAITAAMFAVVCVLTSALASAAQSSVIVRPDPVALGLKSGTEGAVVLRFENVEALYGLEAHLTFDPNIVEVVDADAAKPGVQLQAADWLKDGFVATNQADNSIGKIDFAATLINPALPISGTNSFATINFRAKQDGVSPLTIDNAILVTRDADVIGSIAQNGRVGVSVDGSFPESKPAAAGAAQAASSAPPAATASRGSLLPFVAFLSIVAFLVALGLLVYAITTNRQS